MATTLTTPHDPAPPHVGADPDDVVPVTALPWSSEAHAEHVGTGGGDVGTAGGPRPRWRVLEAMTVPPGEAERRTLGRLA